MMKKVLRLDIVTLVVAVIALVLSMVNTVLLAQVNNFAHNTDNYVNNNLLFHVSKNAGAINSIISCLEHETQNACASSVLDDSKRDMNERVTN
ncbi:MAG: hypothetical protein WAW91_00725 [Candidatus Nanoperiomorbaceae bacterium]